jgi:hypothetical protein
MKMIEKEKEGRKERIATSTHLMVIVKVSRA